MDLRLSPLSAVALAVVLAAGCSAEGVHAVPDSLHPSKSSTTAAASQKPSPTPTNMPDDVRLIDDAVRHQHADPFSVVHEKTWAKAVAAVAAAFPSSEHDVQGMLLARLAGLLDTHTQFFGPPEVLYDAWFYRFADGMYVVAARDPALVGARLLAIDGTSAGRVERLMQPLVPGDNPSAHLSAAYLTAYVDHLHGTGIVADTAHPQFRFALRDGRRVTTDLTSSDAESFVTATGVVGSAAGDFTTAVRRRGEGLWWRVDGPSRTFVLSVNDYLDPAGAIDAMSSALAGGHADRVVLDLRYLRGGDWTPLLPLVDAVANDDRINRAGGLSVLIGRENESAATVIIQKLDVTTRATLVGEPTPAMADPFVCPCEDVDLPTTGYVFSVPQGRYGNGDSRPSVAPDVTVRVLSTDFFAGRDVALGLALKR